MSGTKVASNIEAMDGLYDYLTGIVNLYKDMLPIIKNELAAISREDISSLDENLKTQQALLYKTKNFDKEIDYYTQALSIEASNLTSLIIQLPEDQQLRFYDMLGRFSEVTREVSFYKEKCRALLETRLYTIDKVLKEHNPTVENKTYGKDASKDPEKPTKSFETIV